MAIKIGKNTTSEFFTRSMSESFYRIKIVTDPATAHHHKDISFITEQYSIRAITWNNIPWSAITHFDSNEQAYIVAVGGNDYMTAGTEHFPIYFSEDDEYYQ